MNNAQSCVKNVVYDVKREILFAMREIDSDHVIELKNMQFLGWWKENKLDISRVTARTRRTIALSDGLSVTTGSSTKKLPRPWLSAEKNAGALVKIDFHDSVVEQIIFVRFLREEILSKSWF